MYGNNNIRVQILANFTKNFLNNYPQMSHIFRKNIKDDIPPPDRCSCVRQIRVLDNPGKKLLFFLPRNILQLNKANLSAVPKSRSIDHSVKISNNFLFNQPLDTIRGNFSAHSNFPSKLL